jgi:uncharacterized protein
LDIKIKRRYRDNLHGSIDVSEIEDLVVSHVYFQRLRRIKQTALLFYVFPGAMHTRFEHSLGTLYLADRGWQKILDNKERFLNSYKPIAKASKFNVIFKALKNVETSVYLRQVLRLAALLHDVGHPPLSHSGEWFLPKGERVLVHNKDLPEYLKKYIKEYFFNKKVSHEVYSLMIMDRILRDVLDKNKLEYSISPQDVASIMNSNIPPKSDSPIKKFKLRDIFGELIGGSVDVDRMDYLLRDARQCGVSYGVFDADRILDTLSLYYSEQDDSYHLALRFSGLAAFEDYLRARQSMYYQVYFHKTAVACEAMLRYVSNFIEDWNLPANIYKYMEHDDTNIYSTLREQIKRGPQQEFLLRTLKGIFRERLLWKRVYEFSTLASKNNLKNNILKALDKENIIYTAISSSMNTVVDLKNKKDYLRLVKKSSNHDCEITSLGEYSLLYKNKKTMKIFRIYIDLYNKSKEEIAHINKIISNASLDL